MICPKCGDLMEEQESENVKLERCENCGGLFLDRGEVDLMLALSSGAEGARRLHNVLKF
jgi:Zn-finger nucleic acid-binding protein